VTRREPTGRDGPSWFSSVTLNGGRIGGDVYANNGGNSPGVSITSGEVVGSVFAQTAGVLMSGGTVGAIGLGRNVLTMTGGIVLGSVSAQGPTTLSGASILGDLMPVGAYANLEWHGGTVAGTLIIADALTTTIFGTNFAIDGIPFRTDRPPSLTGLITGTLEDGTLISTELLRGQDYQDSRLYFAAPVPEPSAAVLIGVGVVALAASRRTR